MTFGEMLGFTKRFRNIMNGTGSNQFRDIRLASMMTDLELAYGIRPFIQEEAFEQDNPYLMQLYRTVSEAKEFEQEKRHVG